MLKIQLLVDLLRLKKKIMFVDNEIYKYKQTQKKYKNKIKQIKQKVKNGQRIKVCFSVVFDSCFQSASIFEKMLDNDIFEPFILVIPDTSRGEENMFYQMNKTYDTLSKKYGKQYILKSWKDETKEFIDYSDYIDLAFFNNPYDEMTHKFYSVEYNSNKLLCLYMPYSYTGQFKFNLKAYSSKEYSLFWKIFVESVDNLETIKNNQICTNINNLFLSGYAKMDAYHENELKCNEIKTIIIAPHHTILEWKGGLNIGNFLEYFDFYLELPKLYPNITFIFRPHPLLFVNLRKTDLWGETKVNQYIEKMCSHDNVIYQEGGDYFETFKSSNALIHDCGSFLAEYYYSSKPQCFILRNKEQIEQEFTSFGKKLLSNVYKAFNKNEIIDFIDKVVINSEDSMRECREKFADNNIKTNYPNATECILKNIKKEFNL